MKKIYSFFIIFIFIINFFPLVTFAADGERDIDFNTGSLFAGITVYTTVIQDDGKILVGGGSGKLVRLNSDGTQDNSFNAIFNNTIRSIATQDDGKILVGGTNIFTRLNPDGSLDSDFEPFLIPSGGTTIDTITIQDDGKILVGGGFTPNRIARLNSDGSLDDEFDTGYGFNGTVHTISIQHDGKIIVGGSFSSYNGESVGNIARLNSDGSLDGSFDIGTGFSKLPQSSLIYTMLTQDDEKIIVGGSFSSYNGESVGNIARLNSDGSLDDEFDTGYGFNGTVHTISIQHDGKILVGGNFDKHNSVTTVYKIARLNSDGSLDTEFNKDKQGFKFSDRVETISIQKDGKILVGGSFSKYNNGDAVGFTRLESTPPPLESPTITLGVSSEEINEGDSVEIIWSSSNANSCTATGGWTGSKDVSGSETIDNVTSNQTYELKCTGPGGDASDTVSVTVIPKPEPPVDNDDPDEKEKSNTSRVIGYRPVSVNVVSSCSPEQILTQDLRSGARDGMYHSYTKNIVTEVKILQAHMNRLGFNSGAVDGILGPITDGAIKRMQVFLGTIPDGMIGPITRGLINTSCGTDGLQRS